MRRSAIGSRRSSMGSVDPRLLEIRVCPLCKGKLVYRKEAAELVCRADRLAYQVKDDTPVMLGDEHIVVNVQGDEPLIPPALIRDVAQRLEMRRAAAMSTACHAIHDGATAANPNVVKVVLDAAGYALYFSRAEIPFPREPGSP